MCGVVGIIGNKNHNLIGKTINSLKTLEYRGYDSAGIAYVLKNAIIRIVATGELINLQEKLAQKILSDLPNPLDLPNASNLLDSSNLSDLLNSLDQPEETLQAATLQAASSLSSIDLAQPQYNTKNSTQHNKQNSQHKNQINSPSIVIGHTRWATHGRVCQENAHPIVAGNVAIVHNGIIENYSELKEALIKSGEVFSSQTDTEVIAKLLNLCIKDGFSPIDSVKIITKKIVGSYAFAAIFLNYSNKMICVRKKSPLIIGLHSDYISVASDAIALNQICDDMIYLENGDIVEITNFFGKGGGRQMSLQNNVKIYDENFELITRSVQKIEKKTESISKKHYEHFMLKEIFEQSEIVQETVLKNLSEITLINWNQFSKIYIIACGSSYYAGMVAKYLIEKYLLISVEVDIASEFKYRLQMIDEHAAYIFISQSGETSDTLAALHNVKGFAQTFGIVNVHSSTIAREVDHVFYTHAGFEISVASTKAFIAQISQIFLIAFSKNSTLQKELQQNSCKLITQTLECSENIKDIAFKISKYHNAIFLARGILYPIANEGALKMKEISYIHAESIAAGEIKHGPIALIDENMPVIVLAPYNEFFEKILSNINEVIARNGKIVVFTDSHGAKYIPNTCEVVLLPFVNEHNCVYVYTVAVQILAYYCAIANNRNVDKPRNLAKSVTVE